MALYRMCGLILESNIPLPELLHAEGEEPECGVRVLLAGEPWPVPADSLEHRCFPDGNIWFSLARQASGYLLRFPGRADFLVSADGADIRCHPAPGTSLDNIRHLVLDQVIPLVLSRRGRLVLHASAVVTSEGAIAFLGGTGQGKSTLGASFLGEGFPLLTDDCLLLEEERTQLVGIPSYPGLRLWPDVISALYGHELTLSPVAEYSSKKRLGLDNGGLPFCADPVPLRRIYLLAPPEETAETTAITIAPLSRREAFMELVQYAYCLDITDRERLREAFERFARVAALPFFRRLTFPRDLSLLPAVREAVLEDLCER